MSVCFVFFPSNHQTKVQLLFSSLNKKREQTVRSGAMKTDAAFMPHAFITHLFASPVKLSKKAISLRCGSNIAKQIRAVETKTSRECSCAAAARHYGNVIEREIMSRWRMQLRQREDKAADRRQARSVVRDVIIITKPSFYMECETGALFPPHTHKKQLQTIKSLLYKLLPVDLRPNLARYIVVRV